MVAVPWNVGDIGAALARHRQAWRDAHRRNVELSAGRFPSRAMLDGIVRQLSAALYPQRLGQVARQEEEAAFVETTLGVALAELHDQVRIELDYWGAEARASFAPEDAGTIVAHFAAGLPRIRALVDGDVEAAFLGDPAALSIDEVLICYPSAVAIIHHRLAHALHALGAPLVARIVSELAHAKTGIDIHPGAAIGPGFFIDHGTGVVIGETAIVGAGVRLYQAVTLGARRLPADEPGTPRTRHARHPIVEDDVVIYAGATILGRVTIGRGSIIGGNVWLTEDVAPGSVVTQSSLRRAVDGRARAALFADD